MATIATVRANEQHSRFRMVATWAGTVVLLALLALTTDLEKAWEAFQAADHILFPLSVTGFILAAWIADAATARVLLGYSGIRISFREFAWMRGASYLLNVVNYNLALVMMAAVVKRRTDRGWGAAGSPFLALNFVDLAGLALQVVGGLAFAGVLPQLGRTGTTMLLAVALCALVMPFALSFVSRLNALPSFLGRLVMHDIFSSFRALTLQRVAGLILLRSAFSSLYIVMTWANLHAFNIPVPLGDTFVFNPVIGLVGFLPVSVSGIGTTQFLAREFFGPFVTGGLGPLARNAAVDAYSTASIVAALMVRAVISVICMPYVARLKRGE